MKKISLVFICMVAFVKGSYYADQCLPTIVITDDDNKAKKEIISEERLLWINLYSAISSNNLEMVEEAFTLLISFYGNVSLWDSKFVNGIGLSPLAYALFLGADINIVKYLVKYGAPLDFKRDEDNSSLLDVLVRECVFHMHWKHSDKNEEEIAGIIREYITAAADALVKLGKKSVCMQAILDNNQEAIASLGMYAPGVISKSNQHKETLLLLAVHRGSLEMARLLLANGAGKVVNQQSVKGFTPLFIAVDRNDLEMAQLLLAHGAKPSVNQTDNEGHTPLCLAVGCNNIDMVRLLLQNGAIINFKDFESGDTPLHVAVKNRNLDMVKLLLESGADVLDENRENEIPRNICKDHEIMRVLLAREKQIRDAQKMAPSLENF